MPELKQFYFDDGSSRKRWHVQVRGKTQIVEYGKLGGSLKESKKVFTSPAAAAEQTAKLIQGKKREGYVEINPLALEIRKRQGSRKATETQVKTFEKKIGCALPEEYRNFLLTLNGGHPNPDCVQVPGVEGIDNVGVGVLYHLQPAKPGPDELSYETEQVTELLPQGHLPIAGSSDLFTLSLRPKTFGCVYWWFHETDELDDEGNFLESAGYLLAGSFDEFLTRIALLFGDADELEVGLPDPAGIAPQTAPKATIGRLLALVKHDHTPEKIREIEQVTKQLGDLSVIEDGSWTFNNIDSPQLLRCLLEAGLKPEMTDTDQHSLLWLCAANRECIDLLAGRSINIHRRSGSEAETALMRAIYLEAIPAVKRLVQLGANPTLRMGSYIHHKLEKNTKLRKVVEDACVDWRANEGQRNAAQLAATEDKSKGASKKKGPKPTLKRLLRLLKHDYIPEEFDEVEGIEEVIRDLGDLSEIQDGQWPAIHRFEDPRLLRSLLAARLNPEITAKNGGTLLMQCCMSPACIDLLLQQGVVVDRCDTSSGETALMRASYMGDEECIKRLLDGGANPTLEFAPFAKVMLGMKRKMTAVIEDARIQWNRQREKNSSKAVTQWK